MFCIAQSMRIKTKKAIMYKIEFTLKQHTPIIHFQHNQEGATLRATEVKPKLDRFIIEKLTGKTGNEAFTAFKANAEWKKWLVGNGEHPALDYKLHLSVKTCISDPDRRSLKEFEKIKTDRYGNPKFKFDMVKNRKVDDYGEYIYERGNGLKGYFGNMDKETERKELIVEDSINVSFNSINKELNNKIDKYFKEFIFSCNFGTRSSKGYGSFYIQDELPKTNENYYSFFDITINEKLNLYEKQSILFDRINMFYAALRSGINIKHPIKKRDADGVKVQEKDKNGIPLFEDIYYFKSLAFLYAKQKLNIQWEKKSIKEKFFFNDNTFTDKATGKKVVKYYGLVTQKNQRVTNEELPLFYSSEAKKLIKDLLGLSSTEAWLSYKNATITKVEALNQNTKTSENNQSIFRYKSPIQFKPIKINSNTYRVFIQIVEEEPLILDKWFCIESTNSRDNLFLKTLNKSEFTISKFLNFIFEEKNSSGDLYFDINKHVDKHFHSKQEHLVLNGIFNDIKKNKRK